MCLVNADDLRWINHAFVDGVVGIAFCLVNVILTMCDHKINPVGHQGFWFWMGVNESDDGAFFEIQCVFRFMYHDQISYVKVICFIPSIEPVLTIKGLYPRILGDFECWTVDWYIIQRFPTNMTTK